MKTATKIIIDAGRQAAFAVPHAPEHARAITALLNEIVITAAQVEGITRDEMDVLLAELQEEKSNEVN